MLAKWHKMHALAAVATKKKYCLDEQNVEMWHFMQFTVANTATFCT